LLNGGIPLWELRNVGAPEPKGKRESRANRRRPAALDRVGARAPRDGGWGRSPPDVERCVDRASPDSERRRPSVPAAFERDARGEDAETKRKSRKPRIPFRFDTCNPLKSLITIYPDFAVSRKIRGLRGESFLAFSKRGDFRVNMVGSQNFVSQENDSITNFTLREY
jgi:hypothetical protein